MRPAGSARSIQEPARTTPVLTRCNVLVVGGGSAGAMAATAAARAGARVVLAERYGSLGGLATGGLIVLLLTLDDGRGRQVIGGLCQEVVERLNARGAAFHPPQEHWGDDDAEQVEHYRQWGLIWGGASAHHRVRYSVAYDPEALRLVLNEIVCEAGVDLLLHLWGADALIDGDRISGVAFQSKAGRQAILADVVIDATGDGDVLASAGCAFELERIHPWLWFRVGGVDIDRTGAGLGRTFFRTPNPGQLLFPWGSVGRIDPRIDATDPRDLTRAELECRALVMRELDTLKRSQPGFESAHLCGIATQLGITESRRLVGRYTLSREDRGQSFEDAIAITGHWTKYAAVYAIPYRCLQSTEFRNLLVAGRNLSVDHRTHNATKEIPPCMAVGQAAGLAAAQACEQGGDVTRVALDRLQRELRQAGAILEYPFASS